MLHIIYLKSKDHYIVVVSMLLAGCLPLIVHYYSVRMNCIIVDVRCIYNTHRSKLKTLCTKSMKIKYNVRENKFN